MATIITANWLTNDQPARGYFDIDLSERLVDRQNDRIYPRGRFASGPLKVNPSLHVTVPSTDDPLFSHTDFGVWVTVHFDDKRLDERYFLNALPSDATLDLSDYEPVRYQPDGTGVVVGADGRGIAGITVEQADGVTHLVITYDDGETERVLLPMDEITVNVEPALSIDRVEQVTPDTMTVWLTDGTSVDIELPRGPQGVPGKDGADGAPGVDGKDGAPGPQGPAGPEGPQGLPGKDGAAGPQGPAGPEGPQGPQGLPGKDGAPGANGTDGAIGPQGPAGADGVDGTVSFEDLTEEQRESLRGPQGVPGTPGADGKDGAAGPQGPEGPQGPQGLPGKDGVPGPQGPAGPAGADGVDGTVSFEDLTEEQRESLRGPQGVPGKDGVNGAPGADGKDGTVGPQGPAGPEGPQGLPGKDGAPGADGTDGTVGPQGPEGPQGPQGLPGKDGAIGPQGPAGADGVDGTDGQSALEVWLAQEENVGKTADDFFAALKGDTGERGPAGADGKDGVDGAPGADGKDGERGPEGPQGPQGERGPEGPEGPQGPQGPAGEGGGGGFDIDEAGSVTFDHLVPFFRARMLAYGDENDIGFVEDVDYYLTELEYMAQDFSPAFASFMLPFYLDLFVSEQSGEPTRGRLVRPGEVATFNASDLYYGYSVKVTLINMSDADAAEVTVGVNGRSYTVTVPAGGEFSEVYRAGYDNTTLEKTSQSGDILYNFEVFPHG